MAFELPKLSYEYSALEPYIDARTMEIHHTKHHQGYVNKLNAAISKYSDLENKTLEELISDISSLPTDIQTAVRNNGGGHYNHRLFWEILGPDKTEPSSALKKELEKAFGSFDKFVEVFSNAAARRFGSGWAWLVVKDGQLLVDSTPNQDNPLMDVCNCKLQGGTPILGIDVWEHAYYLKYQNRRGDYIQNYWNVVNWNKVNELFEKAMS